MSRSALIGPGVAGSWLSLAGAALAVPPAILPPAVASFGGDASSTSVRAAGTTTARAQSAVAADRLNVKFCGAAVDGRTNDTPAIDACVATMAPDQTLYFPPGGIQLDASPASAGVTVAFDLSGNTYGTSAVPIVNLVNDMPLRTIVGGGFYFGKLNDIAGPSPTVRIDATFLGTSPASAVANVSPALQTNCTTPAPATAGSDLANYIWCSQVIFNDNHIGPAQNVGLASTYRRLPITDTFGRRGPGWATYWEADDETGLSSGLGGSLVTTESDILANGDDPGFAGDGGDRIDLHIVGGRFAGQGLPARIGHAITIDSGDQGTATPSFFGRAIDIGAAWDTAAIDTSRGQPLVTTLATSAGQGGPGTTLTFPPPLVGVAAGMTASGAGIPAGDTVRSINGPAATVVLDAPSTSGVPSGSTITFTSSAPAIQIGTGQRLCLETGTFACATYSAAAGLVYTTPSGRSVAISDQGGLTLRGHLVNSGAAPSLASCGTGPVLSTTASDRHGTVTPGPGATACTIMFASAYTATPDVVLTAWSSSTSPFIVATNGASVTVGFSTPGKFTYVVEQ